MAPNTLSKALAFAVPFFFFFVNLFFVLDMHLGVDQQDFTISTSKSEQLGIFSIIVKGLDNYPAISVHDKPH